MFTRQQYKAIAEIIAASLERECAAGAYEIAHSLANYFEQDNPRFDRKKFMLYCGIFNLGD